MEKTFKIGDRVLVMGNKGLSGTVNSDMFMFRGATMRESYVVTLDAGFYHKERGIYISSIVVCADSIQKI